MTEPLCATCEQGPTRRYCAPARCYCAHPDCHAYDSWIDLDQIPLPETTTARKSRRTRSSWDDRKETTWIDQL